MRGYLFGLGMTRRQVAPYKVVNISSDRWVNSLRPRRNGRYNTDDIFKCIFLKEDVWIPTMISLEFVPKGPINNIPALIQIMAWRRPGDTPLSEPMMASLLTHMCVTRPQWVIAKKLSNMHLFSIQNIVSASPWNCIPVEFINGTKHY